MRERVLFFLIFAVAYANAVYFILACCFIVLFAFRWE